MKPKNVMRIQKVTVQSRTQDLVICYGGERDKVLSLLRNFQYESAKISESFLENSGRELSEKYKEKLINQVVLRESVGLKL